MASWTILSSKFCAQLCLARLSIVQNGGVQSKQNKRYNNVLCPFDYLDINCVYDLPSVTVCAYIYTNKTHARIVVQNRHIYT